MKYKVNKSLTDNTALTEEKYTLLMALEVRFSAKGSYNN